MITPLSYTVPMSMLSTALNEVDIDQFRYPINEPTGNFFYDPWVIKKEFMGTIWEKILNTLPLNVGEARIITLKPGTCYNSHADVDDRYHLNINGQLSFLVNLDTMQMFPQQPNGIWYEMDAGPRHSAANFSVVDRVQLVVRKLLNNSQLERSTTIEIKSISEKPRFVFDDKISPWLNHLNKNKAMNSFTVLSDGVRFNLDSTKLDELDKFSSHKFKINIL